MEHSLGNLAHQALSAMPAAHGDNVECNGGQPPYCYRAGGPIFENSMAHAHHKQDAEHLTGGHHAAVTGLAYTAPRNVFATDLSLVPPVLADLESEDGPQEMVHLPKLLANSGDSPEVLEAAVRAGMQLIYTLAELLKPHATTIPDAFSFLKSLKRLHERSATPRTVVGVVGNTGAGKSSVINALLDEEEFVAQLLQPCPHVQPLVCSKLTGIHTQVASYQLRQSVHRLTNRNFVQLFRRSRGPLPSRS